MTDQKEIKDTSTTPKEEAKAEVKPIAKVETKAEVKSAAVKKTTPTASSTVAKSEAPPSNATSRPAPRGPRRVSSSKDETAPSNSSDSRPRSFGSRGPRAAGGPGGDRRSPGGPGGSRDKFKNKGKRARDRRDRKRKDSRQSTDLENKVINIRRVTKVTKGGKQMRFSALVVVGDKKGGVGYAIKKGMDFQSAVEKATKKATKEMFYIDINDNGSLAFPSVTKHKAARVFLKPADKGTGMIAGGYIRPVLELAGVSNIYSKIIGGTNKTSGVQAVMKALESYKRDLQQKTKPELKVTQDQTTKSPVTK